MQWRFPPEGRHVAEAAVQVEEAQRVAAQLLMVETQRQAEATHKQTEDRLAREEASLRIEEEHVHKMVEVLAAVERLIEERSLRSQALARLT